MSILFSRTVTVLFFSAALFAQSPATPQGIDPGVPGDSVVAPAVAPESQTPASPTASLRLPAGERVELVLKTKVSSEDSKVGDPVELEVIRPLKVGGLVAIARDTVATAKVVIAEPSHRKGVGGVLAIAFDGVQLVSGDRVALGGDLRRLGKNARQEIDANMGEWTLQTFGFGAPLAPLFLLQKGGKAEVEAGTRVSAYIGKELAVDRSVLERSQPAQAHDVGVVYLFNTWHPTCGSQALPYNDFQKGVVRIDLPPGKYWFHNGASIGLFRGVMTGTVTGLTFGGIAPSPISMRKVLKRPLAEFTSVKVEGGRTYYLRSHVKGGKTGLEQVESVEGEKLLEENEDPYYRVREVSPEMLQNLSARPGGAPSK